MGHYIYKSIPGAKFEVDSPFSFGDMTSQNFPQMKGTSHPIRLFTPERVFMSRIVLLDPKLTPHVNFNNFQTEENFWDVSIMKEQQQPP